MSFGGDEKVLYRGHEAMFRSHPIWFTIYACLTPVGVGALLLFRWWIIAIGETLTVTTARVSLRKGIFSVDLNEILNTNVRNVQLRQTIMQRIFGVGDIGVSSSGQADIEVIARGIRNPMLVKRLIEAKGSSNAIKRSGIDWLGAVVFFSFAGLSSLVWVAILKDAIRL